MCLNEISNVVQWHNLDLQDLFFHLSKSMNHFTFSESEHIPRSSNRIIIIINESLPFFSRDGRALSTTSLLCLAKNAHETTRYICIYHAHV